MDRFSYSWDGGFDFGSQISIKTVKKKTFEGDFRSIGVWSMRSALRLHYKCIEVLAVLLALYCSERIKVRTLVF